MRMTRDIKDGMQSTSSTTSWPTIIQELTPTPSNSELDATIVFRCVHWVITPSVLSQQITHLVRVPLRALGYHPQRPFSTNYPFGTGIIDAFGPDLLHQISKCFMDYLMKSWIWKLMKITWKGRGFSKTKLKMEFDSQFALMPGYTGIQRFEHGALTKTHAWTVHEYKEIMKVIIG